MLYTKIQPKSFLGSGEEDFKCFLYIYGHEGHLDELTLTIWTIFYPPPPHTHTPTPLYQKVSHEVRRNIALGFQRRSVDRRRTDEDGRRTASDHNSSSWTFGSAKLKHYEPEHDKTNKNGMSAQRRLRSAWASAQSDQNLRCPHEETMGRKVPIERTARALIRLGGWPGWSESSLGRHGILLAFVMRCLILFTNILQRCYWTRCSHKYITNLTYNSA